MAPPDSGLRGSSLSAHSPGSGIPHTNAQQLTPPNRHGPSTVDARCHLGTAIMRKG